MTDLSRQSLRELEGAYAVELLGEQQQPPDGWLWLTRGPDGLTVVRRDDATGDPWRALWSGDTPHAPDATGMLSALVTPLADASIPVMVASTYHGDLVLVPSARLADAVAALRAAGHEVSVEKLVGA